MRLHLKRPWSDGTVAFVFSKAELVERLAALIPPPHKNQVLYHGVLAPRAAWRPLVVPRIRPRTRDERKRRDAEVLTRTPSAAKTPRWEPWRTLLERTFGADGFACPNCFRRMRLTCGRHATRHASGARRFECSTLARLRMSGWLADAAGQPVGGHRCASCSRAAAFSPRVNRNARSKGSTWAVKLGLPHRKAPRT